MNPTEYVQWFRQSSPYINAHRDKTFVIMFEGDAIAHDNFTNVVQDIALLSSLGVRLVEPNPKTRRQLKHRSPADRKLRAYLKCRVCGKGCSQ